MSRGSRWPLLALALVAAWPLRGALAGAALYYRDIHIIWHAHAEAFVRAVAGGSPPLWNATAAFGQPMLGDPDYMAAYPLTWLNLILPAWLYYTVFMLSHLVWTAAGAFRLARRWRCGPPAAFVGAALWVLSGPILSLSSLWHHFASACWMPWVFLVGDRALRTRRPRAACGLGLAAGLQLLAGSADVVAMTLLALAVYAAIYGVRWRRPLARRNWTAAAAMAGGVLLAVGLAAVQWTTALDVVQRSDRWSFEEWRRTYWSVHPLNVLSAVLPESWHGLPLHPLLRTRMFEAREPFLDSLYLGLATLPLAGAALAAGRTRGRYLALVALAAVLVSLGHHAPFYSILVHLMPPLRLLRYPVKAWILAAFAWSLLCALGMEAWRGARTVRRARWVAAVLYPPVLAGTAALAAAAAAWWAPLRTMELVLWPGQLADAREALAPVIGRMLGAAAVALACVVLGSMWLTAAPPRRRALATALAALAVADVAVVNADLVEVAPRELYARPAVIDVLRRERVGRLYAYDYYSSFRGRHIVYPGGKPELVRAPAGWPEAAAYALAQQLHLIPSTATRWQVATGYEGDRHGLAQPAFTALVSLLTDVERTPAHRRLLQMGGITHVVALHDDPFLDLVRVAVLPGLQARDIRVFAVPDPLPRAYAVAGARVAEGKDALLTLLDPTFDPRTEILLSAGTPSPPGPAGTVSIVEQRADRVKLQADMARPGYLVLLDTHDPGWRLEVDGVRQPLLRANVVFRAALLPAGRHEVEMLYRPRAALYGLALTLAAALAAAWLAWRDGPRRRAVA